MSITLLSGTPGSGKSLDAARLMMKDLTPGHKTYVITNIPVRLDMIQDESKSRYCYLDSDKFNNAKNIEDEIIKYWSNNTAKSRKEAEGRIKIYWDECQMQLNSRCWMQNQKKGWPRFFQIHRHYGVSMVLIAQMQSMLDKQVRGCIEYDIVHRKIENAGLGGWFISRFFNGGLFIRCYIWNTTRKQFQQELFMYKRRYGDFFDTFQLFGETGTNKSIIRFEEVKNEKESNSANNDHIDNDNDNISKTC